MTQSQPDPSAPAGPARALIAAAAQVTLPMLTAKQARLRPDEIVISDGDRQISRAALEVTTARIAQFLLDAGLRRGDRIALLSENGASYIELTLAAARQGFQLALLNWRLTPAELRQCLDLVQPTLIFTSAQHAQKLDPTPDPATTCIRLDAEFHQRLAGLSSAAPDAGISPEDGLLIAFTSGTSGLPKGAVISHRAALARAQLYITQYGFRPGDTYLAWSPMFHMSSMELSLSTLILGGRIVITRGHDLALMCDLLESGPISNLVLFPGIIDEALAELRKRRPRIAAIRKFGALADLLPGQQIQDLTQLLQVPFANTYASTETGIAPASAGKLAAGEFPHDLAKTESAFCEVRLVDDSHNDVPDGELGELVVRGPTVFSGYFGAEDASREALHDGWYHTGDMFRRRPDGRLDYVDRKKYLIKSGGENIYPAEIETVVRRLPAVIEAAVVRRRDARWGEVPVLVVASRNGEADRPALLAHITEHLAGYRRPRDVVFVKPDFFPRNNTGKILRAELEARITGA